MKIIKVIYNDSTSFILDILFSIKEVKYFEKYNIDDYKQKKKALPIMVRHGTKEVPLIVFEDENLQETSAIWSESKPNWVETIQKEFDKDR